MKEKCWYWLKILVQFNNSIVFTKILTLLPNGHAAAAATTTTTTTTTTTAIASNASEDLKRAKLSATRRHSLPATLDFVSNSYMS